MGDFLLDLVLPKTDRTVYIQWVVAAVFWATTIFAARNWHKEGRTFVLGLAIITFAWFAARTVH
jgi:hypothetical protein